MIYFQLFWAFFKIGLFTFGGGYAMLPMLQKELVCRGWTDDDELMDYYAIGQVTPGIIAVNVSTFVGYKIKGLPGALCTLFGIVMPSILIISLLAAGLTYIWDLSVVQHAFKGIRLVIPALLLPIIVKMLKKSLVDMGAVLILALAFCANFVLGLSPVWIVIGAGCLGVLFSRIKGKKA